MENARYFKGQLKTLGFNGNSETPITPIIVGDEANDGLLAVTRGRVFVSPIVYPTVPRYWTNSLYDWCDAYKQLDQAIEIIDRVGRKLGIQKA